MKDLTQRELERVKIEDGKRRVLFDPSTTGLGIRLGVKRTTIKRNGRQESVPCGGWFLHYSCKGVTRRRFFIWHLSRRWLRDRPASMRRRCSSWPGLPLSSPPHAPRPGRCQRRSSCAGQRTAAGGQERSWREPPPRSNQTPTGSCARTASMLKRGKPPSHHGSTVHRVAQRDLR